MLISFIIPAHNEAALIADTIDAIHAAARTLNLDYEIIVANDASTDATADIASAHNARVENTDKRQIAAARNAGFRASRGQLLFFIDADTLVSAPPIREAIDAMNSGAIGGGGPVAFDGGVPFYGKLILPAFNLMFRILRLAGGAFIYCKREALEQVGGWNETVFAGEEIDLAIALKKLGRFHIVRAGKTPADSIVTSGRKLRTHSTWEIFGIMLRGLLRPSLRRSREGLDLWYGQRRADPGLQRETTSELRQ